MPTLRLVLLPLLLLSPPIPSSAVVTILTMGSLAMRLLSFSNSESDSRFFPLLPAGGGREADAVRPLARVPVSASPPIPMPSMGCDDDNEPAGATTAAAAAAAAA